MADPNAHAVDAADVRAATGAPAEPITLDRAPSSGRARTLPCCTRRWWRQLANARQGTHDTYPRRGGRAPPRRCGARRAPGGPGRARARAPTGTAAASPSAPTRAATARACPRKMRQGGAALGPLGEGGRRGVDRDLQELTMEAPSTKGLRQLLAQVSQGRSQLIVLDGPERNVQLSARNLPHVQGHHHQQRQRGRRPALRAPRAQPGGPAPARGPLRRSGEPAVRRRRAPDAGRRTRRQAESGRPRRRSSAMAEINVWDVLRKPRITEKGTMLAEQSKYVFEVHPDANKIQIKEAVERAWPNVKVTKVNTMTIPGKTPPLAAPARRQLRTGRRPSSRSSRASGSSSSRASGEARPEPGKHDHASSPLQAHLARPARDERRLVRRDHRRRRPISR